MILLGVSRWCEQRGVKAHSAIRGNAGDGSVVKGPAQHAAESLRIDAIVEIGDQQWLRRRWATLDEGGYSQLPWRFVRTEAARPVVKGS